MDFAAFTPHRDPGGALHLPSSSHSLTAPVGRFVAIDPIRTSITRSPSRQHPPIPLSASTGRKAKFALRRPVQPRPGRLSRPSSVQLAAPTPPVSAVDGSFPPFVGAHAPPFGSSSSSLLPPTATAAALTPPDWSANSSSSSPFLLRSTSTARAAGDQHHPLHVRLPRLNCTNLLEEGMLPSFSASESPKTPSPSSDAAASSAVAASRPVLSAFGAAPMAAFPPRTSPLKRSDGEACLDPAATCGSPVPKRRQLHLNSFAADPPLSPPRSALPPPPLPTAALPFPAFAPRRSARASLHTLRPRSPPAGHQHDSPFMPVDNAAHTRPSPRRAFVLRRPGHASRSSATRLSATASASASAASFASSSTSPTDPPPFAFNPQLSSKKMAPPPPPSSLPFPPLPPPPFGSSTTERPPDGAFAGLDGMTDDLPRPSPARAHARTLFSRSLPISASRPSFGRERGPTANTISTPAAYKSAKPIPEAFMSTGLISKRNRNINDGKGAGTAYTMPDTPSKRVSFPPVASTSMFSASVFGRKPPFGLDFDTPGTPSSPGLQAQPYGDMASRGVRLFGPRASRAASMSHRQVSLFSNLDNDDINQRSPPAATDGQSSNDELPPTPTKPPTAGGSSRRSKPNSLRSSLLGRRKSIGPDTFVPPTAELQSNHASAANSPSPSHVRLSTPVGGMSSNGGRASPHTPQGRPGSGVAAGSGESGSGKSLNVLGIGRDPNPATPTAQRDSPASFGRSRGRASVVSNVFDNNVDTSITARFGVVTLLGKGEFSNVFKVERPQQTEMGLGMSRVDPKTSVWAVKKTKRPYVGHRDREAKLREVEVLRRLTGNDHTIQYVDSWEANNHLYIQTEFCENGNLKDFLTQTGFKARLDDFRIWKIILELSLGIQHIHNNNFIHLDLKPANVFIDWGGVLKIGDFGLASAWPAPADIDGEGDREYIGPEVLNGHFDKPADIFALGMIMLEIAGNIVLPDNGASWQRLRTGDLCDLPSLTWSSESSLPRDPSGEPLVGVEDDGDDEAGRAGEAGHREGPSFLHHRAATAGPRANELSEPPVFMCEPSDGESLDSLVQWMISPDPAQRPTIEQIYHRTSVQWVAHRRRAGATIYEGNWGPSDEVVNAGSEDVDMMDAD